MGNNVVKQLGITKSTSPGTKNELSRSVLSFKQRKNLPGTPRRTESSSPVLCPSPSAPNLTPRSPLSPRSNRKQLTSPLLKADPQLDALFTQYASEENPETIDPNGLVRFLNDVEIAPNDVALLVLGWYMKAPVMGVFSREEFVIGLTKLKINSIQGIKLALPQLRAELNNNTLYPDIFKFAFHFYKDNPNHKTLPIDTATMVLDLIASDKPHIPRFTKFLLKQKEYKGLNFDQWCNLLEFITAVPEEELEEYTENGSWPLLFDLYVEWVREGLTRDSAEEEKKEKKEQKGEYEFDF